MVLDPGVLTDLSAICRMEFLADLQRLSRPGAVHVVLPTCAALAPEALLAFYDGWAVEEEGRRRKRNGLARRPEGVVLACPLCPPDTARQASTAS